ncbi:MAG: hypothetical protein DMG16_28690 [Acidobacteria bacterium]|nr:MAG: hypothetical protein DMG16_28690 [Acidobacteriota bacterium]
MHIRSFGNTNPGVIYTIDASGQVKGFASNFGVNDTWGMTVGGGNLFLADRDGGRILKFLTDGTWSTFALGINTPYDLLSTGDYLFAATNDGIYRYDMTGAGELIVSGFSPINLALNTNGDIYAETWPQDIFQISGATATALPEPGTLSLLGGGIVLLMGLRLYQWRSVRAVTPPTLRDF